METKIPITYHQTIPTSMVTLTDATKYSWEYVCEDVNPHLLSVNVQSGTSPEENSVARIV